MRAQVSNLIHSSVIVKTAVYESDIHVDESC